MLYGGMNFPVRPILKEIEVIAGLGFDYLELAMDPPEAHHQKIREQKKEILRALDRHKIGLICHLPTFLSTADLTDRLRSASIREMRESLQTAAELHPLKVVLHPSHIGGLSVFVMDQARDRAWSSLQVLVEEAERLGLSLLIENMFPRSNFLIEPDDFLAVFERFPSLRLTLDVGHAHIQGQGGRRTLDFIMKVGSRIGHIHANDNFGKEDNHLPIGAGTIDFSSIIKSLKEIGYDETITLEVFSRDRDYLRISKEKLASMFSAH